MPIQFRCHHCNKPVQAPDTAAGKSAKCPGCGKTTTVPKIESDDDPLAGFDEFLAGQQRANPQPQPIPRLQSRKPATPQVVQPPIVTQPPHIVTQPQPATTGTIHCPFCGEDIKPTARKCKHCGEWLDKISEREGTGYIERGSADARAVTRGLKEKEYHDTLLGCGGFLALCLSVGAGVALHWIVGVIIFFVLFGLLSHWYYKE